MIPLLEGVSFLIHGGLTMPQMNRLQFSTSSPNNGPVSAVQRLHKSVIITLLLMLAVEYGAGQNGGMSGRSKT